ncbi:HAD family hydrolase [Gordonia sp. 'Campus']|uniref:HAD family hydrolase n=1 Tax=Gordonia sp. 'Campus' TaxID=2915824 RepID=UPI001EE4CE48|nr:HAD family hydrolase [Gordonia sp. 'Campus']
MADGQRLLAGVRAVVFDVGETLVDESRMWSLLARDAGVTPFALMGIIGTLIERGESHRKAWEILGVDRPTTPVAVTADDLYPDALDCLAAAKAAGLSVGIAGNQPESVVAQLQALGCDVDVSASSAEWGVAKPSYEFFTRLVGAVGFTASEILYVGDRLDNDILPAAQCGLRTALLRRGPWGHNHADRPRAAAADLRLDSLGRLAEMFAESTGNAG